MAAVKVKVLRPVTYGSGDAWRVGDVVAVHPSLAALMVREGEAEYAENNRPDTSVPAVSLMTVR